jgi:hypothetical protein
MAIVDVNTITLKTPVNECSGDISTVVAKHQAFGVSLLICFNTCEEGGKRTQA